MQSGTQQLFAPYKSNVIAIIDFLKNKQAFENLNNAPPQVMPQCMNASVHEQFGSQTGALGQNFASVHELRFR